MPIEKEKAQACLPCEVGGRERGSRPVIGTILLIDLLAGHLLL
jgi:hypothetical protein